MAAYYKVEVSLNTNSVTVGAPSAQEVLVTLPLVGPAGSTGATGATGASGQGVPVGGTSGQVLRKASDTNYDTEWAAAASGSGSVTSVALAGAGLTISGSPITTSGTITANVAYGTTAGTAAEGNDSRFVTASTTTPAALGTAAVGTGTTFARADHVHAMPTAANVGAAQAVTTIELTPNGTTTITTGQLPARGIAFIEGGGNFTVNLPTPGIRESGLLFSIKTEHEGAETGDVFITVNHAATTLLTSYDLNQAMGSLDWRWDGFRWSYSVTDAVVVPSATYGTNTTLFAVATTEVAINLPNASGTLALTEPADDIFRVVGSADATKKLAFELDTLVSTATTRTLTVPDSSGTIALLETLPAGGTKTYAVFTALDNNPPATAFATIDQRNSTAVLDFDDATDESAVFVGIMPEGASLGSGLKIRLHWMSTNQTTGSCAWDVSLERMNTDLDSDSFDTIASAVTATSGAGAGIITVTEITLTTIDGVTAGDAFRLKVTRDANKTSSPADDLTNDAELVVVEIRSAA